MVSIVKALLFASLLIVLAYAEKCEDKHSLCRTKHAVKARQDPNYLKNSCYPGANIYKYCPKLCGVCGGEVKTTTTTTTTTETKEDCMDKSASCGNWVRYCRTSPFMKKNCRKTCDFCDGGKVTTTKKPTTTKKTTTTTTKKPMTTKKTTTTTTKKPTTTKKTTMTTTTTTTTTKGPVTNPPSGVCADKMPYCFLKQMFDPSRHCNAHKSICIKSCGQCNGSDNQKCANLTNRFPMNVCQTKDCRNSDLLERNRAHIKCAKYCCEKGQLY